MVKKTNRPDSDVVAFGGGMPRSSYGDRHTVSVLKGDNKTHVTFDLTSKVIDFCLIREAAGAKRTEALVILAEEELVVVDLITAGWPAHSSPYLASLHCSAITAQTTVTVTGQLYDKIISHPQMLAPAAKISTRPWPVNGGDVAATAAVATDHPPATKLLLLTGHEARQSIFLLLLLLWLWLTAWGSRWQYVSTSTTIIHVNQIN